MPEVKHYAVRVHGGPKGEGHKIRAQIHLFDDKNKLVGVIDFFDPKTTLPEDESGELIRMALPSDQLSTIIDILRNEKPIFLEWQDALKNAYISTTQEPVGEGE
ncbi:MAG: hypothetical protein AAFV78_07215 [Bacteroidota bacterium]